MLARSRIGSEISGTILEVMKVEKAEQFYNAIFQDCHKAEQCWNVNISKVAQKFKDVEKLSF